MMIVQSESKQTAPTSFNKDSQVKQKYDEFMNFLDNVE